MDRINDIKTCQDILLDLAKEFHRLCSKNNIPYYMLGGTFLGAIRHKGFIPWDDDMDFGVERKYIDKLLNVFDKQLSPNYRLRTIYNSKCIIDEPFKLENIHTMVIEPERAHIKERLGLNIDIFPLDETNFSKTLLSRNGLAIYLVKMNSLRFIDLNALNRKYKCIAILSRILLFPFSRTSFCSFLNRFVVKQKGNCLSNLHGFYGFPEIIPKSIMGTPTLYQFEDIQLFGPEKAEEYLEMMYGNWRQLPPEEKRHIHLVEAYLIK